MNKIDKQYHFNFQYYYNEDFEEFGWAIFIVDEKSIVKNIFKQKKINMPREQFKKFKHFEFGNECKDKAENFIKKKYPHLAFALEKGIWMASAFIYDREFKYA